MKTENFNIQEVIDELLCTCGTLSDMIERMYDGMDEDDLAESDFETIDNQIFCCEECGWWCEIIEMTEDGSEDWVCRECRPYDNE